MFPGDLTQGAPGTLLAPDNLPYTRLLDYEDGGVGVSDPSQGLRGYVWSCRADGNSIQLRRDDGAWAELFTFPSPYELGFTFDQNMRPLVAVSNRAKQLSLYWYDPLAQDYVTASLGTGRCPRMTMDDKREFANQHNDAILGYIKGKNLVYRVQRERFLVEHIALTDVPGNAKLHSLGMCTNFRVQFTLRS